MRPIGSGGQGCPFNPFIQSANQAAWMIPFCNPPAAGNSAVAAAIAALLALSPQALYVPGNFLTSGSNITQWTDSTGNGNHATQGTGANQPTVSVDGKGGLTCDGVNQFIATTLVRAAEPFCWFMRINKPSQGAQAYWAGDATGTSSGISSPASSTTITQTPGGTPASTTGTLGVSQNVISIWNGASSSIQVNANAPGTGNSGGAAAFTGLDIGRLSNGQQSSQTVYCFGVLFFVPNAGQITTINNALNAFG